MERAIDLLYNDAIQLTKGMADEIWREKGHSIDSLILYAEHRCKTIQDTLAAIKKLKQ